ncbi:Flp family type IVb pilin [Bradyrhizobium sp. 200]|nr:Flp family type IVb pilin [Bradyrhizobium sp. 200]
MAIEYGLITASISLATIAAVNRRGTKLSTKFASINSSLTGGARRLARAESTDAS